MTDEKRRSPDQQAPAGVVVYERQQQERREALESQIELSSLKSKVINDKIQMLEYEKQRIEEQSELLRQ